MIETNKIYNMGCLEGLKQMDDDSVDLIVSDPPYQLSDTKNFGMRQDEIDYAESEEAKIYGNKANLFCGKTKVKGFMGKCYSDDTELLTEYGWKLLKDIVKNKYKGKVYTINPINMNISLSKIKNYFEYEYNNKMINFLGRSVDLLVTPEHKVLIDKNGKIKIVKAINVPESFSFLNYGHWKGKNISKIRINKKYYPSKIFMYFMGLYLGDGYVVNRKNQPQKQDFFGIKVKKQRKINAIRISIEKLNLKYSENNGAFYIYDKNLLSYLKQFGKATEKFIDNQFFKFDKDILIELFNGLIMTDGYKKDKILQYFTSSKRLADDIQRLSLLIGLSCNIKYNKGKKLKICGVNTHGNGSYILSFHKKNKKLWFEKIDHKNNKKKYHKINYKGFVYDINVENNHTLFIRRNGKSMWSSNSWDILPSVEILKECLKKLKSGAFSFWLMTPRQDSQAEFIMRLKQAGFNIGFSPIYWSYLSGFPKSANISKMVDKRLGQEREIVGEYKHPDGKKRNWKEHKNASSSLYQMGMSQDINLRDITIPSSPEAKSLDGSYAGMQLKPAVEVIIVAMKPLSEKSYIDQALKNKKGISWLDDCRIPYQSEDDFKQRQRGVVKDGDDQPDSLYNKNFGLKTYDSSEYENPKGRFPANLLVSDNALDDGKITKSKRSERGEVTDNNVYQGFNLKSTIRGHDDEGSLSRYFDLDKWFEERMPKEIKKTFPFLFVAKPSSSEKQKDLPSSFYEIDNSDKYDGKFPESKADKNKNVHPTVKPIKLFSYLITLGSREDDLVLDPFIGSGTLGISARLTTRNFIGFEREKEYYDIAVERVKKYTQQKKLFEVVK